MDKLFEVWRKQYYTEPVLVILVVITFLISFKKKKSFPQLRLFPVYLASFIILIIISYMGIVSIQGPYRKFLVKISTFTDYVVSVIEFCAFTYFLYTISKTVIKKAIYIISLLTLLIFFSVPFYRMYISGLLNSHDLHFLYIIESSSLLVLCSLHFIDLFKSPPVHKLLNSSNFWISSGLTFYLICTFPGTLLTDYLYNTNQLSYYHLWALIYIFYILLFLTIIKAYTCRSAEAQ
jgi:hypothetical protein